MVIFIGLLGYDDGSRTADRPVQHTYRVQASKYHVSSASKYVALLKKKTPKEQEQQIHPTNLIQAVLGTFTIMPNARVGMMPNPSGQSTSKRRGQRKDEYTGGRKGITIEVRYLLF